MDGTVHDRNTDYMFVAAGLICLLSIYFFYNLAAMTVNGARRTYRAGRWVVVSVAGGEPQVAVQIPAQAGADRAPGLLHTSDVASVPSAGR